MQIVCKKLNNKNNLCDNRYSEEGKVTGNSVCHINGLMRIKLFPDSSKLFICTTSGFILFINDLDLETLGTDIQGFKVIIHFNFKNDYNIIITLLLK